MKKCVKCNCEIVNGENGCMMLDVCYKCNGGFPVYKYIPRELPDNNDYEAAIIARQDMSD